MESYDGLITVSYPFPIAWGIASLSRKVITKKFKVWIADFGDPFMYSTAVKYRPFFYFHYFEWNVLRKADFITIPFPEMKNFFYKKFRKKFRVIPQGVDLNKKVELYKKNSPIRIGFSGNIICGKRDFFSLLDYLISKEYKFEFVIFTDQPELFIKYAGNNNYRLNLREYIERDDLIKELSKLDFLVAVDLDNSTNNLSAIPSKLIDYALSRRPIFKYEHSKLPKEKLDNFMNHDFGNSFQFNIYNHDTQIVTNKFIQLLNLEKAKFCRSN